MRCFLFAAAFLLFCFFLTEPARTGAHVAHRQILGPDAWPEPEETTIDEKSAAFHKPSRFYENEYTGGMCFSKNGWKYVGNLFYFKIGPQLKWGISVSVADPDNNYYLGAAEIEPSKVRFDTESVQVTFGESFIKGRNPDYHIHYVTDNATVDFRFKSRVPLWAPNGDGKFNFGPEDKCFFNVTYVALWADVKGYIKVGGKTHPFDGQGYIDHGHYSIPFNRHNPLWEGFFTWTWEPVGGHMWHVLMSDHLIHESLGGGRIATAVVLKDDRLICATPKFDVKASDFRRDRRTGIEFPWRIDARTAPGAPCSITGVSRAHYPWEVLDIFDELPAYIRPLAKKFLKRPIYFRAYGDFRGKVSCGDEEVSLETPAFHDANYVR